MNSDATTVAALRVRVSENVANFERSLAELGKALDRSGAPVRGFFCAFLAPVSPASVYSDTYNFARLISRTTVARLSDRSD